MRRMSSLLRTWGEFCTLLIVLILLEMIVELLFTKSMF